MKGKIASRIFLITSAFILAALATSAANALVSYPSPTGFVNDFASVLKPKEKTTLENKLSDFEKNTGNEISVAIIKSLDGDTVENYAEQLFQKWGIGKKGQDNGALLLVAIDDRKMRIEVGYGLEPSLTDAMSNSIIRNILTPAFRAGDYGGGISEAVDRMIGIVMPEYASGVGISTEPILESPTKSSGINFSDYLFLIFFAPIWLASILGRSKSWWAGGVLGAVAGTAISIFWGFWNVGLQSLIFLIPAGLFFDFIVSRAYSKSVGKGTRLPWWIGGGSSHGGGFGGGGFGGFGGGGSGGGGSSGSW